MALIIFNSTRATLTYAYFELDPIGFIENLCENTDKPELQCNGKCQLKKVAESLNKEQRTPESLIDFKELILYPSPITTFALSSKTRLKTQDFSSYLNLYSFNKTNDCFHPPKV